MAAHFVHEVKAIQWKRFQQMASLQCLTGHQCVLIVCQACGLLPLVKFSLWERHGFLCQSLPALKNFLIWSYVQLLVLQKLAVDFTLSFWSSIPKEKCNLKDPFWDLSSTPVLGSPFPKNWKHCWTQPGEGSPQSICWCTGKTTCQIWTTAFHTQKKDM